MPESITLQLDGSCLTIDALADASRCEEVWIEIPPSVMQRVADAHNVVADAVSTGKPVYGLTTGLGSRVGEILGEQQIASFSNQILRGRAHAIGEPLPEAQVRGAMIVRLNTLLKGAAGASPGLVECLVDCLKHDRIPKVGSVGSIGASDLCMGATLGLALTEMTEVTLRLRDGLALANHSSFSAAAMALTVGDAGNLLRNCQRAAALSMSAFQANLSPLDSLASAMRPQAGQREAAAELSRLLQGSTIERYENAKRLQDPLSIRNVPQVHGAAKSALDFASAAAIDEINGASDNPVVDLENNRIVSCGAYHTPLLTIASQTLSQSFVHVVNTQLARIARLLGERFTGLPQYLSVPGGQASSANNGFAPVLKIAEALVARVNHRAAPVTVWPSVNAESTEDIQTNALTAIQGLESVIENATSLCAIEMIVGAQALDLRMEQNPDYLPGRRIIGLHQQVRAHSRQLRTDRPMTEDIERIAEAIQLDSLSGS